MDALSVGDWEKVKEKTSRPGAVEMEQTRTYIEEDLLNNSLPPLPENIKAVVEALKPVFRSFDEYRLVGHKGDHANNLMSLGLVPRLDVLHVHRTLGASGKHIEIPSRAGESYEGLITSINEEMRQEIRRIVAERKSTFILMPFPNAGLERMIQEEGAKDLIVLGCPIASQQFMEIENKIKFANMVDVIAQGNDSISTIPYKVLDLEDTFEQICDFFDNHRGKLYFQKDLSGGGDGTKVICNSEEFVACMRDWKDMIRLGRVKVTKGIENHDGTPAYPMNGTGCVIVDAEGKTRIYLDAPSHKPVGLSELGGTVGSGVGNDWSGSIPGDVFQQYIEMSTKVGEFLSENRMYVGLFGPDGLRAGNSYYMNEVNPRFQGTTPYQTMNALMNERIPIELLHYIAIFSSKNPELLNFLPDPNEYIESIKNEKGGFYVKLGGKEQFKIQRDISGPRVYNQSRGIMEEVPNQIRKLLTPEMVYMRSSGQNDLEQYLRSNTVIRVKCPKVGTEITPGPTPFGYILGSGMSVFAKDHPNATDECVKLYQLIISAIKGS